MKTHSVLRFINRVLAAALVCGLSLTATFAVANEPPVTAQESTTASSHAACETELSVKYPYLEFLKTPQDHLDGYVTSAYAITPESLIASYSRGIFPWGIHDVTHNGQWYSRPMRGVLLIDDNPAITYAKFKIRKHDLKYIKSVLTDPNSEYRITRNMAFEQVMRACMDMDRGPDGTWITEEFVRAYVELHRRGLATSVEVWKGDKLVAGNYGPDIAGYFSGESMFHTEPNVGKLALFERIMWEKEKGRKFIDIQQANPNGMSHNWGGREVPRGEFQRLLREAATAEESKSAAVQVTGSGVASGPRPAPTVTDEQAGH